VITHDYARIHEFVGRAPDLEKIRNAILQLGRRAVLITGRQGVGKTALANRVIEDSRSDSTPLSGRFQEPYFVSAYRQPWSTVMALIGQALRIEIPPKTTTEELQQRLIADVSKRPLLVFVDNIELAEGEAAAEFCRAWVAASPKSVLLMTSGQPFITDSHVFSLPLAGVRDYAQRGLLGERLFERFGDDFLLQQVRPLDGIPLSLLYLRWLDPDTPEKLTEHVHGLSADALNRPEAIENLLAKVTSTPAPFMALGLLPRVQFDESLLAFLWDCMGGGSSGAYVSMRNGLIESRLLIPVADVRGTYRVNEDIHKQLYDILSRRIGEPRVENIHFFAAEYFRRQYERRGAVDDLDAFVYHSLECREYAWVYTSLFETDVPQRLQRSGFSVQLRAIMDRLLKSKANFSPAQWARIYLVTASACNDLSAFDDCLDYMRRALEEFSDGTAAAVGRQIAYYSAVAYSNTGRSTECLRSYYEVIAATPGSADAQGCLALAYLGHELKYHDLRLSRRYGATALEIARELNDRALLARALCSLAETEIFFEERYRAAEYLEEAFALCSNDDGTQDAREAGRILKNHGLLDLVNGDLDSAGARLQKAREYSDTVRDRRRVASGDLYRAIVLHRKGRTAEAIAALADTCRILDSLKDGRYLVPALMTLAHWIAPSYDGRRESLVQELKDLGGPVTDAAARVAADGRFELYARFWHKHFRDTVVIPNEEGK
jgi:tetratricopeptide (TPR) repeat protein